MGPLKFLQTDIETLNLSFLIFTYFMQSLIVFFCLFDIVGNELHAFLQILYVFFELNNAVSVDFHFLLPLSLSPLFFIDHHCVLHFNI